MTAPAIALDRLTVAYRGAPVLDGLSFAVGPGEVLALLGPSGSGKTTVFRSILGFAAPTTGSVLPDGVVVQRGRTVTVPPEERRLGAVFQDLALWPHLTVRGHLAFALKARGVPKNERGAKIASVLARLGLEGKRTRYPGELSGGERQRVAIARALIQEPRAVLLDEPLSNLDAPLRRDLLAMLREVLTEHGLTALYITHELKEATSLGARIAILEAGRLVQTGSLAEIGARPATPFVRALFEDLSSPLRGPGA